MEPILVIQQSGGAPFQLPDAAVRALMSGVRLEGIIVAREDARFVMVGNTLKLPLPAQIQLDAGQRVTLELTGTSQGSQLRITPISEGSTKASAGPDRTGVVLSLSSGAVKTPGESSETPAFPGSAAAVISSESRPDRGASPPLSGAVSPSENKPFVPVSAEASASSQTAGEVSGTTTQPSGVGVSRPPYPSEMTAAASAQAGMRQATADVPPMVRLVRQILNMLAPHLEIDAERAASLVPPRVPPNHAVVKTLILLFMSRQEPAEARQELVSLLREALQSGKVTSPEAKMLLVLYGGDQDDPADVTSPERMRALLKTAPGSDLTEKVLASVVRGDTDPQDALAGLRATIRQLTAALRQQGDLMSWAAETGRKHRLEKAIAAVLEQTDAAVVQHLHGERMLYRFWDLSGPIIPGLNHALIHWIPDREKNRGTGAPGREIRHMLELDLSFSALGDIWVGMSTGKNDAGRFCTCRIRCASSSTRELLARQADSLRDGLCAAGYDQAHVTVESWNGDRLAETIRLLRALHPIVLNG